MNQRLGRGLSSLMPKNPKEKKIMVTSIKEDIVEVETKRIVPNPHQPRQVFEEESLQELAKSIKEHGILQPLILAEVDNNEYQVLAGERRLKASKSIGLKKVPAIIRSVSEQQKLELALVENVQRKNLNPIEEAFSYQKLMDEFNLNQEGVAKKVGKNRTWIANHLRLFQLPDPIQKALMEERLTLGHAKAILALKDKKLQMKLFEKIIENKFSVREAENQAQKVKVKSHVRAKQGKDAELLSFEEKLKDALTTKVEIEKRGKKGKIMIEFYSDDELINLVDQISKAENFTV